MILPLTLTDLSSLNRTDFVTVLGGIFEHSPWVAEAVYDDRPFASITALHAAMTGAVRAAGDEAALSLIRSHPDLAGKAALAGKLTQESTGEQAAAGLDSLTAEEMDRFTALNEAYKARFDFPFIMAVRNADKARILAAFTARLEHAREAEIRTAIAEICKIAWVRLLSVLQPAPTGRLTTHVLDTALGKPAAGLPLSLWWIEGANRTLLNSFVTNHDGRLDAPALSGTTVIAGVYEWLFETGVYFAATGVATDTPPFLDRVPLRFAIANPESHYHVPLLLSPWSFSTYRGS